jgi:hypothetical protein
MLYAQASKQPVAIGANYTLRLPKEHNLLDNGTVLAGFLSALATLIVLMRAN